MTTKKHLTPAVPATAADSAIRTARGYLYSVPKRRGWLRNSLRLKRNRGQQ
jgi:hypothetical protein